MFKFPDYILPARYVTPWRSHPVTYTSTPAPQTAKVEKRQSKLTIVFNDDRWLSWDADIKKLESLVNPYRRFYKWYFSETTPHFVMKHNKGEQMFLRANIKEFNLAETVCSNE
jgi:hypothetical protein